MFLKLCITSLLPFSLALHKPEETDSAAVLRIPPQEDGGIFQQVDLVVPGGKGEEDMPGPAQLPRGAVVQDVPPPPGGQQAAVGGQAQLRTDIVREGSRPSTLRPRRKIISNAAATFEVSSLDFPRERGH